MDSLTQWMTQWSPQMDVVLTWGVAAVAAGIGVVAVVNALEMLFDSGAT